MNPNLTEIVYIMDESGSMGRFTQDTIHGFNSYILEQQKQPGEAYLTTVCFNSDVNVIHDHVHINEVSPLTGLQYRPMGMTALLDAVGGTIESVGRRLALTKEEDRPAHVIFVINTDGEENSSKEYALPQVKEMILHQQGKYSWQFLFIGVGIDAFEASRDLGIAAINTASYAATTDGIQATYSGMSCATKSIRTTGVLDANWSLSSTADAANTSVK